MSDNHLPNGFVAWQKTLGYMAQHHSPDAMMKLIAKPTEKAVSWSGTVSWGANSEDLRDAANLPDLLRLLWLEVDRHHNIFHNAEDAQRRPFGYNDADWLDVPTEDILLRLLWTVRTAFGMDWHFVIVYQPSEAPDLRVQTRLLSSDSQHHIGGRGASLLDALRDCFRNSVPAFAEMIEQMENETHDTD
jgi:hypothetical protein